MKNTAGSLSAINLKLPIIPVISIKILKNLLPMKPLYAWQAVLWLSAVTAKPALWICRIRDGRIQLYVRKDAIGEEKYALIKLLDIGDIIGVKRHCIPHPYG